MYMYMYVCSYSCTVYTMCIYNVQCILQALLRAISNSGGHEEIIEPAMCALRHITSRHPNAEMAQNSVRQLNGVSMLVSFLQQQCRWPLLKALIGKPLYCCCLLSVVTWSCCCRCDP